jgi:hypothetical protein
MHASREKAPFWLKASLNYSGPKTGQRSTLELWGSPGLPLRMDLKAGLGITVSMLRIAEDEVLAYYPRRETAYTARSSRQALKALAFACPLGLQDLALILTGQAAAALPPSYAQAEAGADGGTTFGFAASGPVQSMRVDRQGRIISMSGQRPYPWTLQVDDYEQINGRPATAHSYRLKTDTHTALLRIKELRFRSFPWPENALSLPLPEGTPRVPLGE